METQNVEKFYQALISSKYFNKDLQNKLKAIQNKSEYKVFISKEILPISKAMGYDFNVNDILDYEQKKLQTLSEEELNSITGGMGSIKSMSTIFVSALALAGGAMLLSSQKASAFSPYSSISATSTAAASTAQTYSPYGNGAPRTDADNAANHTIQSIREAPTLNVLEDIYRFVSQNSSFTEQERINIISAYTTKKVQLSENNFNQRLQDTQCSEDINALINEITTSDLSIQFKENFTSRALSKVEQINTAKESEDERNFNEIISNAESISFLNDIESAIHQNSSLNQIQKNRLIQHIQEKKQHLSRSTQPTASSPISSPTSYSPYSATPSPVSSQANAPISYPLTNPAAYSPDSAMTSPVSSPANASTSYPLSSPAAYSPFSATPSPVSSQANVSTSYPLSSPAAYSPYSATPSPVSSQANVSTSYPLSSPAAYSPYSATPSPVSSQANVSTSYTAAQPTAHSTITPLTTAEQNFVDMVARKTAMSPPEQNLQALTLTAVADASHTPGIEPENVMFNAVNRVSRGSDWNTRLTSPSDLERELDGETQTPGFGMQFTPLNTIQSTKVKCPQNKPSQNVRVQKLQHIDALMLDTIDEVVQDGDIIQVASQSNGLESTSSDRIVPVKLYQHDHTQGPRASCISVIGAKAREAQQACYCRKHNGQCQDVMREWLKNCTAADGRNMLVKYSRLVQNGYFQPWDVWDEDDLQILSEYLRTHSGDLQLITQLVNCERTGKNVLQVFNFAPSFQGRTYDAKYNSICESVVVAQYKALAQLAAIRSQQLGKNIGLHLTLVGQGAFKNPPSVIQKALREVKNEVNGYDVTIYLHGYTAEDMAKWDQQH